MNAPQTQHVYKRRTWTVSASYAEVLADTFLLWIVFALLRLGVAGWKTVRIRPDSVAAPDSALVAAAWNQAAKAFGGRKIELLVSSSASAPATIGHIIILPEKMLHDSSEEALAAALGYEMAHIERNDFLANLLFEILALPVSFHPAALFIRRRIRQTREMSCDELPAARMMDPRVYANLLVRIAASIAGSGIALPVLAQNPAAPEVRAGVQALNNNDYRTALQHLKHAVAADPSNANARLYLAIACIRQFAALPGPSVTCARPRYKAVLALDPNNSNAMFGLAVTTQDDTQSAHDLMVKVRQRQPERRERPVHGWRARLETGLSAHSKGRAAGRNSA